MLESELERKVVNWCKSRGLLTYKFVSPNNRGVPDRIVVCTSNGCILFLELKQRGKRPSALQIHEINRLREAGCNAQWADSYEQCIQILSEFCP